MVRVDGYLAPRLATLGFLMLFTLLGGVPPLEAGPVQVRFAEGATRGFLLLRTTSGTLVASGDLFQVAREAEVKGRTVFNFKDGSLFDQTVVFTQNQVFTLQKYKLIQRGPAFPEDSEISMDRASGKYRVETTSHKNGKKEVLDGWLDLPADVYNGMVLTVTKNLLKGTSETCHLMVFMPKPQIIQIEIAPAGEHDVIIGEQTKPATHYVGKPRFGIWSTLFAKLLGHMPPDYHVWIMTDEVPTFVRFEGPLFTRGPVCLIELTSPRWPE